MGRVAGPSWAAVQLEGRFEQQYAPGLRAIRAAEIPDRVLRDPALRAAKSDCLNLAEGAGRVTRTDKARAYTVARGEFVEAVTAIEIAAETGDLRQHVTCHECSCSPTSYTRF